MGEGEEGREGEELHWVALHRERKRRNRKTNSKGRGKRIGKKERKKGNQIGRQGWVGGKGKNGRERVEKDKVVLIK